MSKLLTRISHIISEKESAIVVGEEFPYLEEIVDYFNTVFLYEIQSPKIKKRNIIPKLSFSETKTLPRINFLAIDEKYLLEIGNFIGVADRGRAGILLKYQELPSKKIVRRLTENEYDLVDSTKDLHFWKKK